MLKVILLICLIALACAQTSSPGCPPDATIAGICCRFANVFNSTSNDQVAMMTGLITSVVLGVAGDPITLPWFNGINDPTCFTCNLTSVPTQNLLASLIAFFGAAMGCNATAKYTGASDLSLVHSPGNGFVNTSVNKAAFEHFNFQAIRAMQNTFLPKVGGPINAAQIGAIIADIQVISFVLDSFRQSAGSFGGFKAVCNAADCLTSPYTLWANSVATSSLGNAFAPTYLTVPLNFQITFVVTGSHTFNQAYSQPAAVTDQFNSANCPSANSNVVSNGLTISINNAAQGFNWTNGLYWYGCNFHCSNGMWAILNVAAPAPTPAPTTAPTPSPTPAPTSTPTPSTPTPKTPTPTTKAPTPAPTQKSAGNTFILSTALLVSLLIKLFF